VNGDRFERDLRRALESMTPTRAPDRLHRVVDSIPTGAARSRLTRPGWGVVAAVVGGLAMATVVIGIVGLGRNRPTTTATGSASASFDIAALNPRRFASDPRMAVCLDPTDDVFRSFDDVLAAFELTPVSDYRKHLAIGYVGSLASSSSSGLVVIARSAYPPPPISGPFFPGSSPSAIPAPTPLLGFHAVCVGVSGHTDPIRIGNVADRDLILPPKSASITGPVASRYALLDGTLGEIFAMTWDERSHSLWLLTTSRRLVRVDANGHTISWPLPSGRFLQPQPSIQGGLTVQPVPVADYYFDATDLAVDDSGAVWIAAGYGLVRFDPATGKATLREFPSKSTTIELDNGGWLSGIATEGEDVLVARDGSADLLRISADLRDRGSIRLPQDATHVTGIAVSGERIFVAKRGIQPSVLILHPDGRVVGNGAGITVPRSIRPAPGGNVAFFPTWSTFPEGELVRSDGTSVPLVIPIEPVGGQWGFFNNRLLVATDWRGRTWYAGRESGGEILVVEATPDAK